MSPSLFLVVLLPAANATPAVQTAPRLEWSIRSEDVFSLERAIIAERRSSGSSNCARARAPRYVTLFVGSDVTGSRIVPAMLTFDEHNLYVSTLRASDRDLEFSLGQQLSVELAGQKFTLRKATDHRLWSACTPVP